MEIPTYDQFFYPLLRVLAAHPEGLRARDARELTADLVGLTAEQREELLPSGRQEVYKNRIGWANDRLKRQSLSRSPKRGTWEITDKGRAFLAQHPNGIDDELLAELCYVGRVQGDDDQATEQRRVREEDGEKSKRSPEERIDAAVLELNESLRLELLEQIIESSPSFFERLVLDVLHAMGYGGSREALEQTGGGGDGGIDGIITLDRLGLEKVYVQAKRYAEANNIGRPAVQAFYGALAGQRAKKGVFITTSGYTRDARDFADSVDNSIVLVDGEQLTQYMIDFGVGVAIQRTVAIGRVDSDYFEQG